jgi:uncharacterized protein YjbI with pentapeptide repeats
MDSKDSQPGTENFSALLDELSSIARVRGSVEREYRLIKLSEEAKERFGIDPPAYLELYSKYYSQASQVVRIRAIGGVVYKALAGAAALGATLSALNLYGYFSDQRAKAITENWHTIDAYSDKPYDGGRKAAVENLLSYGQVLYNANFNRAPFIYLKAKPACTIFGFPFGAFSGFGFNQSSDASSVPRNCIRAELQNSEFRGAKLYGSDFSHANLYKADFSSFTTRDAKKVSTEAQKVNFSFANLRGANFREADLTESNFYMADLSGADMRNANLKGVTLCKAKVSSKTLGIDRLTKAHTSCKESATFSEP